MPATAICLLCNSTPCACPAHDLAHSVGQPGPGRYPPRGIGSIATVTDGRRSTQSVGDPEGSSGSVGDSLGSLGDSVGSLGDSLGSLGDSLGSLGLSLGSLGDSPGSLGDSVGLPVGRGSTGGWVGRAGTGDVDPVEDSSIARGLAGTESPISGAWLPGPRAGGRLSDGVDDDFSSGATGETGEIRLTPDSSPDAYRCPGSSAPALPTISPPIPMLVMASPVAIPAKAICLRCNTIPP